MHNIILELNNSSLSFLQTKVCFFNSNNNIKIRDNSHIENLFKKFKIAFFFYFSPEISSSSAFATHIYLLLSIGLSHFLSCSPVLRCIYPKFTSYPSYVLYFFCLGHHIIILLITLICHHLSQAQVGKNFKLTFLCD